MITLTIRNLPRSTTEQSLKNLFSPFGTVRGMTLVKDLFSGECKGFATINMEGHEARAAIEALDQSMQDGRKIYVARDRGRRKGFSRRGR